MFDSFCAVYDVSGAASDRNCVVLSDIHIDIMDYIQPASCTDAEFRQMWAEFEWENKVSFGFLRCSQFPEKDWIYKNCYVTCFWACSAGLIASIVDLLSTNL